MGFSLCIICSIPLTILMAICWAQRRVATGLLQFISSLWCRTHWLLHGISLSGCSPLRAFTDYLPCKQIHAGRVEGSKSCHRRFLPQQVVFQLGSAEDALQKGMPMCACILFLLTKLESLMTKGLQYLPS